MKLSMKNLKTALTMLLAITVLASSSIADDRLKSPLPTVSFAQTGTASVTNSIVPRSEGLRLPSESRALLWSAGATVLPIMTGVVIWKYQTLEDPNRTLPIVLVSTGVILGPSFGYLYGGCSNRGLNGVAIRILVVGAGVGIGFAVGMSMHSDSDKWMDFSGLEEGIIIGSIGCGIAAIHALYDLAKVHGTVKEQNERRTRAALSLAPRLYGPSNAPGLQLALTF